MYLHSMVQFELASTLSILVIDITPHTLLIYSRCAHPIEVFAQHGPFSACFCSFNPCHFIACTPPTLLVNLLWTQACSNFHYMGLLKANCFDWDED